MNQLKTHPAADAFPMMDASRFEEVKADIAEKGQLEPITLCDGMILDGRNRYKACVELGIEPAFREWPGNPWHFAWSMNGQRRDLADMQRGAIKIICDRGSADHEERERKRRKEIDAEANRKRSEAAKEQPRSDDGKRLAEKQVVVHNEQLPDRAKGRSARAKEANVSTATQARVEALANNRPDLLEKVAKGEIKGTEALRQMKKDQVAERVAELPDDKFTVIYADPPWKYGDSRALDGWDTSAAEGHYPTMPLSELKALDVPKLAADDCVLWLWATCPLLEDALELAAAWGFKYKAQFVWDKVKHNMGHYNSVRHEMLLVCTKGSCTPQVTKLYDSVQSIERAGHSVKPDEFRAIIDTLYPNGNRIELFARRPAEGWQTWGNEA
jgi:N6-adenosine-specific RNA methylase IME4